MFIRGTKNVNVFVVAEVEKPFPENIFRPTELPPNPTNWSRLGSAVGAMKNAEIEVRATP